VDGDLIATIVSPKDSPVAVSGCWQCHGSEVKALTSGTITMPEPNAACALLHPDHWAIEEHLGQFLAALQDLRPEGTCEIQTADGILDLSSLVLSS
jgi:hypothetical protein